MAENVVCRVHPVVLFSIVDSFERRNEDAKRVIGTLLGSIDKGTVEVTNCFTVPHNESEDEVAIDIEFARNMYELHKRVNPAEVIVGWYSTGLEVTEHSVLIHEYYSREAKNPVHLTLDTTVKTGKMNLKAYVSSSMGIPGKTMGTMFTPVRADITSYEPEKVGLETIKMSKFNAKRTVSMASDLQQVAKSCGSLQELLASVAQYLDEVLAGKIVADNNIGRQLMDLINAVPKLDPAQFQEMLNSSMKDLLMVVYLSKLTRTQLMLAEKVQQL